MEKKENANQEKGFAATAGQSAQAQSQAANLPNPNATGGPQENQLSGQTPKGAHNQEMENRNPQGNQPNQNRSARQEDEKL